MPLAARQIQHCECDESKLVVRAYLGRHMDQMRQGYLVALCPKCMTAYRYELGDCFVLKGRRKVEV